MTKLLLMFLACFWLTSCGGISPIYESRLNEIENQLAENKLKQSELQTKIDLLAQSQDDSAATIMAELQKTQHLLTTNLGPALELENQTGASRPTKSKAQWLEDEGKVLVGEVETITLTSEELTYQARIDTGATSSSLDARDISRFERDGKSWIRFKLFVEEEQFIDVERPVIRWVRIFQSGLEEGERRPVVEMTYKFGDIEDTAEFTLTDRSHLEFPALIGRNVMTDRMIVDVSDTYIFSPE